MASQPSRRSREAARGNPLVDYINNSKLTPKTAWEYDVPLLIPQAREKMAKAYRKMATNIVVYYGPNPPTPAHQRQLQDAAFDQDAILLVLLSFARDPRDPPFYLDSSQRRGSAFRTTPMTPFTLLHRLGDAVQDKYLDTYKKPLAEPLEEEVAKLINKNSEMPAWYEQGNKAYAGIDTAAGRLGALQDWEQGLSDLFAKFLLTGEVAYKPPETEWPFLQEYYEKIRSQLPAYIAKMTKYLRPGAVFVP
jgi:hypothetical protein